ILLYSEIVCLQRIVLMLIVSFVHQKRLRKRNVNIVRNHFEQEKTAMCEMWTGWSKSDYCVTRRAFKRRQIELLIVCNGLISFQPKKKLIMKRESSIMLIAYGWFQINSFMSMGDNGAMKHCLLIDFQL
ncbi:hypothetical protein BLOT_007236, partial [Blomia tropicalis]